MKQLVEFFHLQLQKLDMELIIMLDSLDQLSPENGAHRMTWLPQTLAKNVKVIVSTLPGEQYKVMPHLKVRLEFFNPIQLRNQELSCTRP